jgi:hypothetical protein
MSSKSARRCGSLAGRSRRLRVAGLVAVVAAALVALMPLSAQAQPQPGGAMVFTHSAKGGELKGGRLTLRGVGRRVTWIHNAGRSGTTSVRLLHRAVFGPAKPVTGTLHVAGHRGGDEPTFRLSNPRYKPARRTVSYRARPLNNKPLPSRAARAAGNASAGKFAAASLTMAPAAPPDPSCQTTVDNQTNSDKYAGSWLTLTGSDSGHGTWATPPPYGIAGQGSANDLVGQWQAGRDSDGTCSSSVTYAIEGFATVTVTQTDENGSDSPSYSCTTSTPRLQCTLVAVDAPFVGVLWKLTVS